MPILRSFPFEASIVVNGWCYTSPQSRSFDTDEEGRKDTSPSCVPHPRTEPGAESVKNVPARFCQLCPRSVHRNLQLHIPLLSFTVTLVLQVLVNGGQQR